MCVGFVFGDDTSISEPPRRILYTTAVVVVRAPVYRIPIETHVPLSFSATSLFLCPLLFFPPSFFVVLWSVSVYGRYRTTGPFRSLVNHRYDVSGHHPTRKVASYHIHPSTHHTHDVATNTQRRTDRCIISVWVAAGREACAISSFPTAVVLIEQVFCCCPYTQCTGKRVFVRAF